MYECLYLVYPVFCHQNLYSTQMPSLYMKHSCLGVNTDDKLLVKDDTQDSTVLIPHNLLLLGSTDLVILPGCVIHKDQES